MPLHITLQPTQVREQQILRRHEITNFEHDRPEVLVILRDGQQLAQVEQLSLVPQSMVQVPKLSLQLLTIVLPSTNPQLCPTFGSD